MESMRGSLIFQSRTGQILLVESSQESLLQVPHFQVYEPFSNRDVSKTVEIAGPMKIIETKATERNVYLNAQSSRVSGSYVTMRVPGSTNKLVMFEFNSNANISDGAQIDDSPSWLGPLVKP